MQWVPTPSTGNTCFRCSTRARVGCISLRDGSEPSTTAFGTLPARRPACRFTPCWDACASDCPPYLTGGDGTVQNYLAAIEGGRAMGIQAYKFHTYKGGDADIPIFREVRREVGDAYDLINDPVCSYTLREALAVGRVMEELGFLWLEEPMHEQKLNLYQETVPRPGHTRQWRRKP